MKVILLKDISKVGKKFDVKDVADGFALNSLIPKGFVKVATPAALKEVEALKAIFEGEKKVHEDLLSKNLHEIEGKVITVALKASEKGHLFAGIHQVEVADIIKQELHADILPDFIELPKPIKEVGSHVVEVKAGDKKAVLTLVIEAK